MLSKVTSVQGTVNVTTNVLTHQNGEGGTGDNFSTEANVDYHKLYEQIQGRPCDFVVQYTFFTAEEGGRRSGTPAQGYRSDFMYEGDTVNNGLYVIYPEFLDEHENVILDTTRKVPISGKANMWILNENFRQYHKSRIKLGIRGYLMEGPHKVAKCEVVQIIGLK